jgi:hypothetical protein
MILNKSSKISISNSNSKQLNTQAIQSDSVLLKGVQEWQLRLPLNQKSFLN